MSACVYLCMYVFVYVCLCMCVLMCVHAYVLVHMCLSVYTCVHVYVCVFVCHTRAHVCQKRGRTGRGDLMVLPPHLPSCTLSCLCPHK